MSRGIPRRSFSGRGKVNAEALDESVLGVSEEQGGASGSEAP